MGLGRIFNEALLARINLPNNEASRLMRYLNACHLLGYCGLSPTYNEKNFFDPMNESLQLLTDKEIERVKEIGIDSGGSAYRELIGWCLEIIYHHFNAKLMDSHTMDRMVVEVLTFRGAIGSLYDYDDQPIPFVYVHLLTLLVDIYMPLLAYSQATQVGNDVQGVIVVILAAVYTLGLVAVGRALSDPYGKYYDKLQPE
jgi:predicted membrane chloride channel (bestrophin family)